MSVEVAKSQHKYIIGPKGNSINEILADTGVFVEMPSSDSTSETITLRGPQEKLGLGDYLLLTFLENQLLQCCKLLKIKRLFALTVIVKDFTFHCSFVTVLVFFLRSPDQGL